MELRDPETADTQRVRELVESAMTASYALSPQQIDALLEDEFGSERLTQRFEDSDSITYVGESSVSGEETTIGGFAEALLDDYEGEVRWLFVDPEHRGKGIGTQLFETAVETLREQGADRVVAIPLWRRTERATSFSSGSDSNGRTIAAWRSQVSRSSNACTPNHPQSMNRRSNLRLNRSPTLISQTQRRSTMP